MSRILIVGGYGAFGARAARRLAREPGYEIVIAGRSKVAASAFADELARTAAAKVSHAILDAVTARAEDIRALSPTVVINASGPFQAQSYGLARACIGAACHYVDLADARAFVTGIAQLDREAHAAGVSVISGASSVPGLSSTPSRSASRPATASIPASRPRHRFSAKPASPMPCSPAGAGKSPTAGRACTAAALRSSAHAG